MRLTFYCSTKKEREAYLAEALLEGTRRHGDELEVVPTHEPYHGPRPRTEVALTCGIKGVSKRVLAEHRAAGRGTVLFDKGYFRTPMKAPGRKGAAELRVAVGDFHPFRFFEWAWPDDRWRALGRELLPEKKRNRDQVVVYAGSSQKYATFHEFGDVTDYAIAVVSAVRHVTGRRVIYRPKPSFAAEAPPVPGTTFSGPKEKLVSYFERVGTYALVTHGSNAALDALVAGVPVVVLGPGVASLVASNHLTDLADHRWDELGRGALRFPSTAERQRLVNFCAYHQWTFEEFASGEAWDVVRREVRECLNR